MDSSTPSKLYLSRAKLFILVVPLVLLISFVVFSFGSKSYSSWSFPYSLLSNIDNINHGGIGSNETSHEEVDDNINGGLDFTVMNFSDHASNMAPLWPLSAPSPAPQPEAFLSDNSSEHIIVLPKESRHDAKLKKLEFGLAKARAVIREAFHNSTKRKLLLDEDYIPLGPSYINAEAFHRSYLEMEKLFKVHVYEEGEPPLFHDGPCRSIYSSEGIFIHNLDKDHNFRTKDPEEAHVHFLPFSVVKMVGSIYKRDSHSMAPLILTIRDYINVIADKYRYWNRSLGADHFMLSCHDWGPYVSKGIPYLYDNSIRVLCNANTSEGFKPNKDASLPEINIKTDDMKKMVGGPSASRRPILAFFAGGDHGPVRPLLLKEWKGKDNDVQVYEYLPKGISYYDMMRKSRFCLCPSGYEVASPRIVEAIYLDCVPVTISDHYVLPFSDVLNYKAFSVQVSLEDIPNIKKILSSISPRQYIRMQRRVKLVRRHFMVNNPPKRYDVYHMILHSIWLRRLNVRVNAEY